MPPRRVEERNATIEDAEASITYHRLHIERLEREEQPDEDMLSWHKSELTYWKRELDWLTT